MNYLVLRKFAPHVFCDNVISEFHRQSTPKDLSLSDGDDKGDVLYHSTRSKNLSYKYLTSFDDRDISNRLLDATGLDFKDSINAKCLPVFAYGSDGEIKAHRGVKKESNTNDYQEYVAVLQLTQRGEDFDGGRLYLNAKAEASRDGKTVWNDYPEDRFYPMLNKGDVIIFHNPTLVHGVDVVKGESAFRATCSWRTNQKQVV